MPRSHQDEIWACVVGCERCRLWLRVAECPAERRYGSIEALASSTPAQPGDYVHVRVDGRDDDGSLLGQIDEVWFFDAPPRDPSGGFSAAGESGWRAD